MSTEGLGKVYADRQVVVRQGEIGDCMFSIQSGRVEIVRETEHGEVQVGELGEGDIFGEMAILQKEVRSATVRACGEARVLTIDKRTFLRRVQEDPSLALNVARTLCARVRRLDAEIACLKDQLATGAARGDDPASTTVAHR